MMELADLGGAYEVDDLSDDLSRILISQAANVDATLDPHISWLDLAALSFTSLAAFVCPSVPGPATTITTSRDISIAVYGPARSVIDRWWGGPRVDEVEQIVTTVIHPTSAMLASSRRATQVATNLSLVKMPPPED